VFAKENLSEGQKPDPRRCITQIKLLKVWNRVVVLGPNIAIFRWSTKNNKVRNLSNIQLDFDENTCRPIWMKASLHERELIFGFSNGTVHRLDNLTYETSKEVVKKVAVDPFCMDADRKLKWIVSRGKIVSRKKQLHFIKVFCRVKDMSEKMRKKLKIPESYDKDNYFQVNRVRTHSRVKMLRVVTEGDRLIICCEDNSLLMMDLNEKDLDERSMIMRGRGNIQCMELSVNEEFLFLGTSLRTLEIVKIKDLRLKHKSKFKIEIQPSVMHFSNENNRLVICSRNGGENRVYELEKLMDSKDDLMQVSEILKNNPLKEEEKEDEEEDEFDDEEMINLKARFRKKNNQETLDRLQDVNKKLLVEMNNEDKKYQEAKGIEKTMKVKGLNKENVKLVKLSIYYKDFLNDACSMFGSYMQILDNMVQRRSIGKLDFFYKKMTILMINLREKKKIIEELEENFGSYMYSKRDEEGKIKKLRGFSVKDFMKEDDQIKTMFNDMIKLLNEKDEDFKMSLPLLKQLQNKIKKELKIQVKKMELNRRRQMMRRQNQQRNQARNNQPNEPNNA
jgi:hypothetical protein